MDFSKENNTIKLRDGRILCHIQRKFDIVSDV